MEGPPKGMQLTPLDEAFVNDPYRILQSAQEMERAYYDEQFARYLLLDHDDVQNVLRNRDYWVEGAKGNPDTFPHKFMDLSEEPMLISMDDPHHKRLRNLVSKPFTQKAAEAMRGQVRQIAEDILDTIDDTEFDFARRFAAPFAIAVIANMMGFSEKGDQEEFTKWSDTFMNAIFSIDLGEERKPMREEAQMHLRRLFMREITARRQEPRPGPLGDMVEAQEGDERLRDQEIVRMCEMMLIAGNVTTRDTLGNGLKALLENPDQLQKLRDTPALYPNAVEEMLRYDCPVQAAGRIPSEDIVVSGCPIKKGEFLYASLAAANRDPRVYPKADTFDIERADVHHQAFGGGAHFCMGASLARVELQEAFAALFNRYPKIELSDKGYVYKKMPNFRGLAHFWIKVEKR